MKKATAGALVAALVPLVLGLGACAQPPVQSGPSGPAVQAAPAPAPDARVAEAQAAALAWLALADAGKYADTWALTTPQFQRVVPQEGWEPALRSVREPLGALKSRKLVSAEFRATLPGAPEGEYVVIQYESAFEKKAQAIETITPARGKDGRWQVSGYYLR